LNKLSVTEGFDLGQTWQNMISQRVAGATYTNTTGKPIMVSITSVFNAQGEIQFFVDNYIVAWTHTDGDSNRGNIAIIVPNNSTYKMLAPYSSDLTFQYWLELR
jgi:hypothetical protein